MHPDLWLSLDALAGQQGMSTNALLEAVARKLAATGDGAPASEPRSQGEAGAGAYKQVSLRLRESDRNDLKDQAAATGHSVTGYITALVRSRIRKAPLLAVQETVALLESNRQLAAVGRNLNTVVHRLHQEGRWAGNLDLYAELLASVKRVRARLESVIASAHERAEEY